MASWYLLCSFPLSSVILIDSTKGNPVHVLMLFTQAVRGLPRLRAPDIVPCVTLYLLLVRNSVVHLPSSVIRDPPKVRERIHLLPLLILNEYAARYAIARHYLGLYQQSEIMP